MIKFLPTLTGDITAKDTMEILENIFPFVEYMTDLSILFYSSWNFSIKALLSILWLLKKDNKNVHQIKSWNGLHIVKLFLSLSIYLSICLYLGEIEIELTLSSLCTTPHHQHRKLFKYSEVIYTQVWYIIGIVSSSPTVSTQKK